MNQQKQGGSVGLRTRRALNSLQYSPNGRDIVGLSPRKSNHQPTKLMFDQPEPFVKMNKRTSISLPDVHADGSLKPLKTLSSSTPLRSKGSFSISKGSPSKLRRMKNEISIIAEEKENPNYSLHSSNLNLAKSGAALNESTVAVTKAVEKEPEVKTFSESGVQCDRSEEDIVTSDVVPAAYWKLLAHKRYRALQETKKENSAINDVINELNERNEATRSRIKELEALLEQFEEIKCKMLEIAEAESDGEYDDDDDDDAEEDSGFDDPAEEKDRKKFKQ